MQKNFQRFPVSEISKFIFEVQGSKIMWLVVLLVENGGKTNRERRTMRFTVV